MYAVVKTGGKQYKVAPGSLFKVEKIAGPVGETVSLSEVLMVSDDSEVKLGQPSLAGAAVDCDIVEQARAKKVIVFKMKRRKGYRKKTGHRQAVTTLRVKEIKLG
jgi:large subunit ribosomal protein L21